MPQPPQRILIVRPSALGDVARTVPVLVSLKRAFPEAHIDWLVNDGFVDAVAHHPDLHEIVPFPRREFRRNPAAIVGYMKRLRARGYDAVYDLQGLARSGWLAWSTRAEKRVGPADARELAWLAYTHRVKVDAGVLHTVDRMLAVVAGDGVEVVRDMRLYVGEEDRRWADGVLARNGLSEKPFAVIAPTAKWRSKCWPVDRFDVLMEKIEMVSVVVGSSGDREGVGTLLKPGRVDLIGQTTVGKLMAVIDRAALVVANDSASLHLAVGLGKRCVGVFGPTDVRRVGPYRYPEGVVAAEGFGGLNYRAAGADQSVIGRIPVEKVIETVRRVLRSSPPVTRHTGDAPSPVAVDRGS